MDVKCPACHDVMPDWMVRAHATARHGFPACAVCGETVSSNVDNFFAHIATHEVESPCPQCSAPVRQKDKTSHAETAHNYPGCSLCSKTFESIALFYDHVRSCSGRGDGGDNTDNDDLHVVERPCPFVSCAASIRTDKPSVKRHLEDKHGFLGFYCKKCDMGKDTTHLTSNAFLRHIENCFFGKTYECVDCRVMFSSRHRLAEHNCLPPGVETVTAEEYARRLHGRNLVGHLSGMNIRLEIDLSRYVPGLPALLPLPSKTYATSFAETAEEAAFRERFHGGEYKLSEDSRIFEEHVSSVPWLYRFMGSPWELGRSLMPDMKLALVHVFKTRPSTDLWLFLVLRFKDFFSTPDELEELKRILGIVALPPGATDPRLRDLEHIELYCREIRGDAVAILKKVEYVCDNDQLTSREVGKELRSLERAIRKRDRLSVNNLPVGHVMDIVVQGTTHDAETRVAKRTRFERGEITVRGEGVAAVDVQRVKNKGLLEWETRGNRAFETSRPILVKAAQCLHVADDDPWASCWVDEFLEERLSPPPAGAAPPTPTVDARAAAAADDDDDWSVRFWRTTYTIFRDFVLYFVNSKTMERLLIFSNFINDEPTWKDLEQLLRGFAPFVVKDKAGVDARVAERATMLEVRLHKEALWLKNLHRDGARVESLPTDALIELVRQVPLVKSLRLHRTAVK